MRTHNILTGKALLPLLIASAACATPVQVTLENADPAGLGPLSFIFDLERQPSTPFDFPDINDFSGDYVLKEEPYRINVSDYFRVEMDGWVGYGFNWLLETWPRGLGIFEEYCEVRFFSSPGETLVLQGAWSSMWSEDTPLFAAAGDAEGNVRNADLRITELREVDAGQAAVPEPASAALFAAGIFALFLGWTRSGSRKATKSSSTSVM